MSDVANHGCPSSRAIVSHRRWTHASLVAFGCIAAACATGTIDEPLELRAIAPGEHNTVRLPPGTPAASASSKADAGNTQPGAPSSTPSNPDPAPANPDPAPANPAPAPANPAPAPANPAPAPANPAPAPANPAPAPVPFNLGYVIASSAGGGKTVSDPGIGIDTYTASVNLDPQGRLYGYEIPPGTRLLLNQGMVVGNGRAQDVAWGAWIGGPTSGKYFGRAGDFVFDGTQDAFHYAVGSPHTASLPTSGVKQYHLVGATRPTKVGANGSGTLEPGARVDVDFAARQARMTGHVIVDGQTYNIDVTAAVKLSNVGDLDAGASKTFWMQGFFVGNSPSQIVLAYYSSSLAPHLIRGAACFRE